MLSCRDIHVMTSDYLDKRLTFMQRMNYRTHMFICHDCKKYLAQFRATLRVLRELRPEKPSEHEVDAQVERMLKQRRDQE